MIVLGYGNKQEKEKYLDGGVQHVFGCNERMNGWIDGSIFRRIGGRGGTP